jgi:hypothetical protein
LGSACSVGTQVELSGSQPSMSSSSEGAQSTAHAPSSQHIASHGEQSTSLAPAPAGAEMALNGVGGAHSGKGAHDSRGVGGHTRAESEKVYSVGVDHFEAMDAQEVAQVDHLSQW